MQLTPEQQALLPSDDDVAFYREHGYYVSPKIFSDDEIDEAVYGGERYYAGERDFLLAESVKPFEGWRPEHGDVLRVNDYVSLVNRELAALAWHPLLGAIAARLAGTASVRLWHDQMIYKPAGKGEGDTGIGWHTDRAYWKTCSSEEMLTAWIPFQDSDESLGTLTYLDGSHRWTDNASLRGFHTKDIRSVEADVATGGGRVVRVPMNLQKGQVSFHHCMTVHGSGANRGGGPRHSISVHLQDEANRYREHRRGNGELVWHRNDMLCRSVGGEPDYADPDICPVLWSEG